MKSLSNDNGKSKQSALTIPLQNNVKSGGDIFATYTLELYMVS
jgi:hypothetical protein